MFEAHPPWMLMMFLSTFSFPTPEDAGINKKRVQRSRHTHTHTLGSHIKGKLCDVSQ